MYNLLCLPLLHYMCHSDGHAHYQASAWSGVKVLAMVNRSFKKTSVFQLRGLSLSNSDVIRQVHNSFSR